MGVVDRSGNDDELKKAYCKLKQATEAEAEAKFKQITEAYDVLSDPAIYGEEGLKNQPPDETGASSFQFNRRNDDDILSEFFGSSSHSAGTSGSGRYTDDIFGSLPPPTSDPTRKAAPIEFNSYPVA